MMVGQAITNVLHDPLAAANYVGLLSVPLDMIGLGLTAVVEAIREVGAPCGPPFAEVDDSREATWRAGALNAEDALKTAHAGILAQRTRIRELLGRIRDLDAEPTEDDIGRITTENTTLKERVRQLSSDNRRLDERLKAARSNLRLRDRRIAGLEVRLTESAKLASLRF